MKKLLLVVAALVGLGCFVSSKAETFVGVSIGVPVPVSVVYGPGLYCGYGYGGYYGYWAGAYWHPATIAGATTTGTDTVAVAMLVVITPGDQPR